jgi:hypothetical protein
MSVRCATRARIEAGHRYGGFYRGDLANPLPMALVALDAMGADDAAAARLDPAHLTLHAIARALLDAYAVCCDDEHDVKLAYRCWREWQARGDDLYRRCASARVCEALAEMELC